MGLWEGERWCSDTSAQHLNEIHNRSVEDLKIVAQVLFGQRNSNYYPAPIPFREVSLPKKLRFGFYTSGTLYSPEDL